MMLHDVWLMREESKFPVADPICLPNFVFDVEIAEEILRPKIPILLPDIWIAPLQHKINETIFLKDKQHGRATIDIHRNTAWKTSKRSISIE